MRNLKKILALVLALVMSLSLMATAGAADTTASGETITPAYQTAIDVLKGVEVFRGYEDGTIRPQNTITRAEVAAILYRIATGDVNDAKVSIYTDMANVNFTDLANANWAKGYINYCANAQLIVGMGDGTFKPQQNITGYATLAMVLRALGYDKNGEFKGSGWEIRTAAQARELGILKNVTTDLGSYATRELVSELLFRAILNETVTFSYGNQNFYKPTGETLAAKNLGLYEVKGVVMANEYANLDATSTLKDGQTKLVNSSDNKSYLLDTTTTLDDIGETRLAYVQDFNPNDTTAGKVLAMDGTGLNATAETTAYAANLNALKSEASVSGNAEGENYINFNKYDTCHSDYRIKYVMAFGDENEADDYAFAINAASGVKSGANYASVTPGKADDGTAAYVVTRVIAPGQAVTTVDQSYIKDIFADADRYTNTSYYWGEVYVGTQSLKDISDEISYEKFEDEYLKFDKAATVSANENGNWVKVIDNNLDGKTDYIFKVVYTVAQVSKVVDDTVTLDVKNHNLNTWDAHHPDADSTDEIRVNNLTSESVVSADTLAKGDVVYYAIIDGKAQTYKCDTVTAQIEKVDHNKLIAYTTDNAEYTESQVCEHIEDEAYEARVRNLSGKVSYDLFFDRGGFLAAFVKTEKTGDFQLITDGWYNRLKANKEFAVRVYNDETKKQDIVDIDTNASLFVFDTTNALIQNNNWNALKGFGGTNTGMDADGYRWGNLNSNGNKVHTTVAAITADGTILPVENSAVTGRYDHAMIDLWTNDNKVLPLRTSALGAVYYTTDGADTAYNRLAKDENVSVRALDNTIYYVVYPDSSMESGVQVLSYTGYNSGIESDFKSWKNKGYVEDVYAVGTLHQADNNLGYSEYYTADVVVVELNNYDRAGRLVLVVDDTARFSDVRLRDVQIIDNDGELKTVTVNWTGYTLDYSDNRDNHKRIQPGLYYLYDTSDDDIYTLGNTNRVAMPLNAEEILKAGCIATGQVEKYQWTVDHKYVVTNDWHVYWNGVNNIWTREEGQYDLSAETPLYTLAYNDTTWKEYAPTITKVEHDVALAGRVNETLNRNLADHRDTVGVVNHNTTYYNYNDIMVFYNSKGAAVYAVSFENQYKDTVKDYAQTLWLNLIPAAEDTNLYVDFYGVSDNSNAADLDAAVRSIKVSYDTALAWYNDGKDALTVKNADRYFVTENGDTIEGKVPNQPAKTGVTYQLNIQKNGDWQIWTLEVESADVDVTLKYKGEAIGTEFDYPGVETTLGNVMKQFSKPEKASWNWTFTDKDGNVVPYADDTVWGDGFTARVVVTAQDGKAAATYKISFAKSGVVDSLAGDRTAANNDVDTYEEDAVKALTGDDAVAAANAKTAAKEAIKNATTKEAINKAVVDYKAAIDGILAGDPPAPPAGDVKTAGFENNQPKFEYTDIVGDRQSIELTIPASLTRDANGKITVTAGTDVPAAAAITNTATGDRMGLMIVKDHGTFATADDADILTNDLYAETGCTITAEVAEGTTVYFYYFFIPADNGGSETPVNPPVNPPTEPVDPSEPPTKPVERMGTNAKLQTLAIDDPAAGEKRGTVWVLMRKDLTPNMGDTSAYESVTDPAVWTGAEGQPTPSEKAQATAEANKKNYYLWFVVYTYVGNVTVIPDLATKEVCLVIPKDVQEKVNYDKTAVMPGETVTLTAKEGYVIKSGTAGETALTVSEDGKTATFTVPAGARGTITVNVVTEADQNITINLSKGTDGMIKSIPAEANGTAEKIEFTIEMTGKGYKPVVASVKDDKGTISDKIWSWDNVTATTEDGTTWKVVVANAKDGMTIQFTHAARNVVTVKAVMQDAPNADKPKEGFVDGKFTPASSDPDATSCEFTFKMDAKHQPKVTKPVNAKWEYELTRAETPDKDNNFTWTLSVTKISSSFTITVDSELLTLVELKAEEGNTRIDAAGSEFGVKKDLSNGKVEFKIKLKSEDAAPKLLKENGDDATESDWTFKYDETAKVWTVSATNPTEKSVVVSTAPATPVEITCKENGGVSEPTRTKYFAKELANGGKVTFQVKIADGFTANSAADANPKYKATKTAGLYDVEIATGVSLTEGKLVLSATGEPEFTMVAKPEGNVEFADATSEKLTAEFAWKDSKHVVGEATFTGIVTAENFVITANEIKKNTAAADQEANYNGTVQPKDVTITRSGNTWTIVFKTDNTGADYQIEAKQVYNFSLTTDETEDYLTIVDKEAPYTGEATTSAQIKVKAGYQPKVVLVTASNGTEDKTSSFTNKVEFQIDNAASTETMNVYDVVVATENLTPENGGDVVIKLETEPSDAAVDVTVAVATDDGRNASDDAYMEIVIPEGGYKAPNGEVVITVEMDNGYFPVVTSDGFTAKYALKEKGSIKSTWELTVSGVSEGAKEVKIIAIAGVSVLSPKGVADIQEELTETVLPNDWVETAKYAASARAAGDLVIDETVDEDGVHHVTITGVASGFISKDWWDTAVAEAAKEDGVNKVEDATMADFLPGLFAAQPEPGWDTFCMLVARDAGIELKDSDLIGLYCVLFPGVKNAGDILYTWAPDGVEGPVRYTKDKGFSGVEYELIINVTLGGDDAPAWTKYTPAE